MTKEEFQRTVLVYAHAERLWKRGDRILAAVSGGPDSLGLLLFLHAIAEREGLSVGCCCVDHHLRPGSGAEADYVERVCGELGIPFTRKDIDVNAARQVDGGSVETVARRLRYAALEEARAAGGYDSIALAHHADDQAETVLFHLLRGAGARGLSGMAPRRGTLIRPFLRVTKADIADFISEFPYTPCHDETNDIPDATRNKIRLTLMPQLLSYNPRLTEELTRLADILRAEDVYLTGEAETFLAGHVREEGGVLRLPRAAFTALPLAMQRRVLRGLLTRMGNAPAEFEGVERMRTLAMLGGGKRTSAAGVMLEAGRETLSFYRGSTRGGETLSVEAEMGALYENLTENPLTDSADTAIIEKNTALGPWRMQTEILAERPLRTAKNQLLLDADKVGRLMLRYPAKGERMAPRGMEGTKAISRILQEAGVPAAARPYWPVVSDTTHIYWVGLLRGSRYGLPGEGTRHFLRLTLTCTRSE